MELWINCNMPKVFFLCISNFKSFGQIRILFIELKANFFITFVSQETKEMLQVQNQHENAKKDLFAVAVAVAVYEG